MKTAPKALNIEQNRPKTNFEHIVDRIEITSGWEKYRAVALDAPVAVGINNISTKGRQNE